MNIKSTFAASLERTLSGGQTTRRAGGQGEGEGKVRCGLSVSLLLFLVLDLPASSLRNAHDASSSWLGSAAFPGPLQFADTVEPVTFAIFRSHNKLH